MRKSLAQRFALALAVTLVAGASVLAPAAPVRAAAATESAGAPAVSAAAQQRAYLGIGIADLNGTLAGQLGLSRESGVVVLQVVKDGPAQKGGLVTKDIITRLGATAINGTEDIGAYLAGKKPGDKIILTVLRQGRANPRLLIVTLGTRPGGTASTASPIARMLTGTLLPKLKELKGVEADQRFDHLQGGALTVTDKAGTAVTLDVAAGVIRSVKKNRIVVHLNGKGAGNHRFEINAETKLDGYGGDLKKLEIGDNVVVVSKRGDAAARLILLHD